VDKTDTLLETVLLPAVVDLVLDVEAKDILPEIALHLRAKVHLVEEAVEEEAEEEKEVVVVEEETEKKEAIITAAQLATSAAGMVTSLVIATMAPMVKVCATTVEERVTLQENAPTIAIQIASDVESRVIMPETVLRKKQPTLERRMHVTNAASKDTLLETAPSLLLETAASMPRTYFIDEI